MLTMLHTVVNMETIERSRVKCLQRALLASWNAEQLNGCSRPAGEKRVPLQRANSLPENTTSTPHSAISGILGVHSIMITLPVSHGNLIDDVADGNKH